MIGTSSSPYPPMRVKCIQRCSLAARCRSDRLDGRHVAPRVRRRFGTPRRRCARANAIATRKMALATTLTCGGTATRATPQTKTGNVCVAPRVEVRDHEVVDREREAEQGRGEDRRREQRQGDLAERGPLVRAEVHRRLLEVTVEPDQARLHGDDDEADDEHHVRDEDRHEPQLERRRRVQEEGEQRRTEHDLRGRHRQEHEHVRPAAPDEPVADDRQRDERAEGGGDDRREEAHLERL